MWRSKSPAVLALTLTLQTPRMSSNKLLDGRLGERIAPGPARPASRPGRWHEVIQCPFVIPVRVWPTRFRGANPNPRKRGS
jgi:hypothetical protein